MHGSYGKLLIAFLGFLTIAVLAGQAGAQQRGVALMEITMTIVIHGDGSATVETHTRQPIVTITATGQRLIMPRCAAEPRPGIPESWHLRTSSRNTGTECIITFTESHDTLQSLREQIHPFDGDISERDGRFTLTMSRNDRSPQTPLLRYKMTYHYLITVPYLDSFSGGAVRQGDNQVAFTTTNPSHSIEIRGHLEKVAPPPSPSPSPSPSPPPPTTGKEKRPYLGCWAAQNGNVLFVAMNTIQTARSDRALSYQEAFRDVPHSLFSLKLLEVDESKEFQPYLSMEVVGKEMKTNDYVSYEDFLNRKSVGHESWFREDCENVLPKLKTPTEENTQPATTQKPKKDSKSKKALKRIWDQIKKPN